MIHAPLTVAAALAVAAAGATPEPRVKTVLARLDALYPDLDALYCDLHRTPELSRQEEKTAARMAAKLRAVGLEVTERVGGHGVVGVLKNGQGPTVMLRTELDALPVKEETGLPYASTAVAKGEAGTPVPVMHACGHDVHMSSWVGAATLLAGAKDRWRGTLVMVAQPAEEAIAGAAAMLKDGLYTRFPRPDFALAVHDTGDLPAGQVGYVSGFALANSSTVHVTVHGRGAHGAYPQNAIDPVVIAARVVVSLQTVVAREMNPLDPSVITVGAIHGGTRANIIPDEVKLDLTVRSYKDEVQRHLVDAIGRIARAEALAAAAPREPTVEVERDVAHSTWNDPALTKRLVPALSRVLGPERVVETPPVMGAEDFSEYGRAGVPAVLFWVGAHDPKAFAEAKRSGQKLPGTHSAKFAPEREPTIRTAVTTLVASALELLGTP
jgi:amidohydrolase